MASKLLVHNWNLTCLLSSKKCGSLQMEWSSKDFCMNHKSSKSLDIFKHTHTRDHLNKDDKLKKEIFIDSIRTQINKELLVCWDIGQGLKNHWQIKNHSKSLNELHPLKKHWGSNSHLLVLYLNFVLPTYVQWLYFSALYIQATLKSLDNKKTKQQHTHRLSKAQSIAASVDIVSRRECCRLLFYFALVHFGCIDLSSCFLWSLL